MSGGVGPTCDMDLPKGSDQLEPEKHQKAFTDNNQQKQPAPHSPGGRGLLALRQVNAMAVVIVFSASGMVCLEDLIFVGFSLVYIHFIARVAFPSLSPSIDNKADTVIGKNNIILNLYVFMGILIGLFIPIAYIFEGILEGDKEGIKAAAPHVFLLASQMFLEEVVSLNMFSLPLRVFVPVFYNARRILTIAEWFRNEVSKVDEEYGGSANRLYIGRGLAAINMVYWCFNLFGYLLPVCLPKAFKTYYSKPKQAKD